MAGWLTSLKYLCGVPHRITRLWRSSKTSALVSRSPSSSPLLKGTPPALHLCPARTAPRPSSPGAVLSRPPLRAPYRSLRSRANPSPRSGPGTSAPSCDPSPLDGLSDSGRAPTSTTAALRSPPPWTPPRTSAPLRPTAKGTLNWCPEALQLSLIVAIPWYLVLGQRGLCGSLVPVGQSASFA